MSRIVGSKGKCLAAERALRDEKLAQQGAKGCKTLWDEARNRVRAIREQSLQALVFYGE
jgi:hypothetical protein